MIKTLAQSWLNEGLLHRNDHVIVGVSGGPDSMALLHLLLAANQTLDWHLQLHIAHLDHQLRGEESTEDAAFVQAAAEALALPCTIAHEDIAARAKTHAIGVEEAGRQARYTFYHRVCLQTGAKLVAVGHHADDNAETILHRVLRGTGLRGLSGIPRRRELTNGSDVFVVRPLLKLTRPFILKYLEEEGIAFREDRTNTDTTRIRNRIRHQVLPMLERDINPQTREAITRLGEQAQWLVEFLHETVQRTFETLIISRTDQTLTLNVDTLSRKSRIVQTEIVRLAYASFELGEQDLAFSHLVATLDLVAESTGGKHVQLPKGMIVEKRYGQLTFSLPTEQPRETIASEIAVHVPGRTTLPIRRIAIECTVEDSTPAQIPKLRRASDGMEEFVDYDAVKRPLVVRTRRPGERFFPLGAPGTKTLSDFLADNKVDPKQRERVAVLCDHLGPIWVIGHRIDDRVKLTELTRRVLHLRAIPLEPS